jgi:MarR family transcriptional regulator, organic hydroperoxide resistance regulator
MATSQTSREAWKLMVGLVYPPRFLAIARKLGLTPPGLGALRLLDEPRTMGEIASFLHCDPSNVTGIVDNLEEKGLAERRPSSEDRRVKLIELTVEGRRTRTRLVREIEKPPDWMEALSAEDQATLRDLLQRAVETTPGPPNA